MSGKWSPLLGSAVAALGLILSLGGCSNENGKTPQDPQANTGVEEKTTPFDKKKEELENSVKRRVDQAEKAIEAGKEKAEQAIREGKEELDKQLERAREALDEYKETAKETLHREERKVKDMTGAGNGTAKPEQAGGADR